jgi:hypothetical protein
MTRGELALMAVLLLGGVAAAATRNTAMVVFLCFLMWRLEEGATAIRRSLTRAGVDLRQRPDGEWEVSVMRETGPIR